MKSKRSNIITYFSCVKIAVAKALAYRSSFFFSMFITILSNTLMPLITLLIYRQGASFPGFSIWEVLLLQSVYLMSLGISSLIFNGVVWDTMSYIREGNFEIVLLKPTSPLFYIIATNFSPQNFGLILAGAIMTIVSFIQIGSGVSTLAFVQFLILFIVGVIVMGGFYLLMAATSFKWVGNSRIPEMFDSIRDFGKYPIGIFPRPIQNITTFIIPVAMFAFYPSMALLKQLNGYELLLAIPCVIFLFIAIKVYNYMIHLYEGVGG